VSHDQATPDATDASGPSPEADGATREPPGEAPDAAAPDEPAAPDPTPSDGDAAPEDPPRRSLPPPRSGLRKGLLGAVLTLLGVLAVVFVVRRLRDTDEPPRPRATLVDAIPDGAFLIATADLRALRREPMTAPFLTGERELPGLGSMSSVCGFDPLASVEEMALGVPDTAEDQFGIVARGAFPEEPIVECARKIILARGGTPIAGRSQSFRSIRDSGSSAGEIAVRADGPLLFGGGPYLQEMMRAAEATPKPGSNAAHVALRKSLAGFDAVRVSVALSPLQRKTITDELARTGGRAPPGVAFISGAALGARFEGDTTHLLLVLRADEPSQVAAVADALAESVRSASDGPAARMIGAAELLGRVRYETQDQDARATLAVTASELATVLEKAGRLVALMQTIEATPQPPAPQPPSPQP
jgi:hypothetical protein